MRVLSLGAGVQSTTVLLMSLAGELPAYDLAIFADTQAEPPDVYEHLTRLEAHAAENGLRVERVTRGSLTEWMLNPQNRSGIQIPVFIKGEGGRADGMLNRQCTERFKTRPLYKWLNQWRDGKSPVHLSMGISLDEIGRMRDSYRPWIVNEYPLIDARMTRWDCQRWLDAAGWTAPRSACTYCPYHSDREWRHLRDEQPEAWNEAVAADEAMRVVHAERMAQGHTVLTGTPFVHRSLLPLSEVDLSTPEDHGQLSMFGQECEGLCGI